MEDDDVAVVIDNGSGTCKAGFCTADSLKPDVVLPTVIGRSHYDFGGSQTPKIYFGDEMEKARGGVNLAYTCQYPIKKGIITNWDDMEKIWHHIFYNKLCVAPKEHPVLLTESPLNPKANREKMAEIMFETFVSPAVYVANQAVLSLFSTGRATGTVYESGDDISYCVPICDGQPVPDAIISGDVAGRDLTNYLEGIVAAECGHHFSSYANRGIIRDIKEKLCYVALDFDQEMRIARRTPTLEKSYVLPDGHSITLNSLRFECPEVLFQLNVHRHNSIQEAIYNSIVKVSKVNDNCHRQDISANIILSGGNMLFPGVAPRVRREITALAPPTMTIGAVTALSNTRYSAWTGGVVLASLSTFQRMWISRYEYNESGPSIIHRKLK